ncbi:MAG: SH3 domain-containing protein [Ignavibacteria bacterium]
MQTYKIQSSYNSIYKNPIVVIPGEIVKILEIEKEEKWKGWIKVESSSNAGWIPIQIIELSDDGIKGKILENYTAKELDVDIGDEIQKINSLNGWTWSRRIIDNEEGWIPDEIIE